MNLIIPLGGIGQRFKDNNYHLPKGLVKIFGKPILYYLLDSLHLQQIEAVIIPYNKEYLNYNLESQLKKDYPHINFKFHCLIQNSRGAAESIYQAFQNTNININLKGPILCLDGDTFYHIDIIRLWNGENKIFTFHDNQGLNIYSYIKINQHHIIEEIKEKEAISNLACSGAYGFSNGNIFLESIKYILDNNLTFQNEFYTSRVIQYMISQKVNFNNQIIENTDFTCLGTPIQVMNFYHNYPRKSCLNHKIKFSSYRYCFDLDNTLVTFPEIHGDYTTVKPICKNINFLRYLKKLGNTIIIYTARRMKTLGGNLGKVTADIGKITFDTLEKLDIPYDEIYFGKPHADIYIDDLALNSFQDMEKYLGYYQTSIEARSFNELSENIIETYTKSSQDLSGEIYYYQNIPNSVKDLFTILLDYDSNNRWYKMVKIKGMTLSHLYLHGLLKEDILNHIMNSLVRLHQTKSCVENNLDSLNIYRNYAEKLKRRYQEYDYSRFPDSEKIFQTIFAELEKYENEKSGKIGIIHGDPIMTNIIINNYDKIKFIDMRGKLGDTLTIYGDIFYDWAKLYQSLLGYDKILQDKSLDKKYERNLIAHFKNFFVEKYSESQFQKLKILTQSLLFSLIPLHDNNKCYEYFNLIQNI
jgi:capsule biosynthesis phosphatase